MTEREEELTVSTRRGISLAIEGVITTVYGIAGVISGFQGNSIPPSTDLLLEVISFGFANTSFDKQTNPSTNVDKSTIQPKKES